MSRSVIVYITKEYRNLMQSGKLKTNKANWIMTFKKNLPPRIDPNLGWGGSNEVAASQTKLKFSSLTSAIDYAKSHNYRYLIEEGEKRLGEDMIKKSYLDNFKPNRKSGWTH